MYRALKKPPYKKVQITDRDDLVIRTVDRYRLVTTTQLMAVTGAECRRSFNSRLQKLWAADILARPEIQRQINSFGPKRPLIHALGQQGAHWMTSKYKVTYPKRKGWKTANELKSINFIDHRLGTTDTMLSFEAALARMDRYRLVDHHELLLQSPPKTMHRRYPFTMPTRFAVGRGEVKDKGTKPDYPFAIEDLERDAPNKALLFLEWDNNTEDYVKKDPTQSSIVGKYLGYADVYQRKLHTHLYGFKKSYS